MKVATVNVAEVIRAVLRDTDLLESSEIANAAYARISASDRGAALRDALRALSTIEMARARMRSTTAPASTTAQARPARSAKVAGIREAWRSHLRDRLPGVDGEVKMLGTFGYDDLMAAAATRRAHAKATLASAETLERLAEAVQAADVDSVSDLPDDTLRALLS